MVEIEQPRFVLRRAARLYGDGGSALAERYSLRALRA
jgi:hypothetical protein